MNKATKNILKSIGWIVATPFILILLLFIALYIPPVQKWAVDLAADYLSEETGMKVSVDHVLLKFPLDLSMGGVVAVKVEGQETKVEDRETMVEKADTVLDAEELLLDVDIMPLFKGEFMVDNVTIKNTKINTLDFVDAMQMKGHVGELQSNSISFLLDDGTATVPTLSLKNSELTIELADSVPEDTTESEAFVRMVDLQKIHLDNVALYLRLAPSKDSTWVTTHFTEGDLACRLDLENSNYYVKPLTAKDATINYDAGTVPATVGFDPTHINLTSVNISIDSLSYLANGDTYVGIRSISGKDRSGLDIKDASGAFRMDSTTLYLDDFNVSTTESDLHLQMTMDMDAFAEENPGAFSVEAAGTVGKSDIMLFTADFTKQFGNAWPNQPMAVVLIAGGNMQTLNVSHIEARMPGAFDFSGNAVLTNLMDPNGNIGIHSHLNAGGANLAFIKKFLPADVASSFNLPRGMKLSGDLSMENNRILADLILRYGKSSVALKADYNMNNDAYDVDLIAKNFVVNSFVPLSDPCNLTGRVKAKGQGFDFNSSKTYTNAKMDLQHVAYGTYYLDNTTADASLKNHILGANMYFADQRLDGHVDVSGTMTGKALDAKGIIDLPFADVKALGFSDDPLTAHATHGEFTAQSNFGDQFLAIANIEGLEVVLNDKDSLQTEKFDLFAESTADSTNITLKMSDLYFDLHSPNNLFKLIDKYTKVGEVAGKQMKERALNLDDLKQLMPEATLRADIGHDNPLSKFIRMMGYDYEEVYADLHTSQQYGLQGDAHVYNLKADSIWADTIAFNIQQDSTQITFNASVSCPKQAACSPFTAYLDGFVSPRDVNAHLVYMDDKKVKGIDLGLDGEISEDSNMHLQLFPEKPILAYHQFKVNDNNYIDLHQGNKVFADVFLQSETDSCTVSIYANPTAEQKQNIDFVVRQLNMDELMSVLPFLPKMSGMLNLDLNYNQTEENFTVEGLVDAQNFNYEGTDLGDLMSTVHYQPMGESGHSIRAMVARDDFPIATVQGTYGVDAPDYMNIVAMMDNLPLSTADAFIPDQICGFTGTINGGIAIKGKVDSLMINGELNTQSVHVYSDVYSFNLTVEDEKILFNDSRINFNEIKILGANNNPLTINGYVDFSDFDEIKMNLSIYGKNFLVFDASRTRKSALFGKLYGDFFARVNGTTDDLKVRGLINVLTNTDITYIMTNTPLTVDYRLDDIVTFVDFSAPPSAAAIEPHTFMGIDMQINLEIEDGAQVRCEFSADKQSYVNIQGGGSMTFKYSPEGVINLIGRYTVNEGVMKYTLPIIPLKTFNLTKGSYIEFTGEPMNPTLNIAATEETKASVSNTDGSSRSVRFNVGLKITNTLENMGLEFTIEAPEDLSVQTELSSMTAEDKNKLAVALLATGMYLSSTNQSGFSTTNALNNFLQSEINNIAGKAVSTAVKVDMNVGMEQTKRYDGTTRTDYSFKFTKRFFSDRLNVVIGGRINADGNKNTNESGAYIDDISLEWRLDNGGTQYIRLFHDMNYDNLVEGQLTENGGGVLLKKKLDSLSELFIWKKKSKKEDNQEPPAPKEGEPQPPTE